MEKNKNTNKITSKLGYNLCPSCGKPAYAITTDDDMHRVGCIYCGFIHGVENYIGDCDEQQIREMLRIKWNERFLKSEFSVDFFESWNVPGRGYAIVQSDDHYIVGIEEDYRGVIDFAVQCQDDPYDLYMLCDNYFAKIGTTSLVWETINANVTMREASIKNTVETEKGYNFCPECGSKAYAITTEDGTHRVGCLYCGFANGIEKYIGDQNSDEIIELLRRKWNSRCLESEFGEGVVAACGVLEQGFLVAQSKDDYIVYLSNDFAEVLNFIKAHQDTAYTIYENKDGKLSNLGPSFLVWKTLTDNKTT